MNLLLPGDTFPANLADRIAVARMDRGPYLWSPIAWSDEPPTPPEVYRQTEDGWLEVGYRLIKKSDRFSSVRQLALHEAVPGDYLVAWSEETCKETPAPAGDGIRIGQFTMTDAAPRPEELGTAIFAGVRLDTETVSRGIDAACREVEAKEDVLYLRIDVKLSDAMSPWLDTIETAVVEGERMIRGYAAPDHIGDGMIRSTLRHVCAASDRKQIDNALDEGDHEIAVLARIDDEEPLRSTPVTLGFSCR
jgi:hypothetical protein